MAANQFSTSGALGVDFDERITGTGTSLNQGNQFALGTMEYGADGTGWMYVHAAGAITIYDWVAIDENYEAVAGTTALAQAGHQVGFAQAAFADNEFGWVAIHGANIHVRAAAACAPDTVLYTSGTAGVLNDDSSSVYEAIVGVVLVGTATATGAMNGYQECIATFGPRATSP